MLKFSSRDTMIHVPIKINQNVLMCEYAKTEKQRTEGLMNVRSLPMNQGMLFDTFGKYRPTFHMRDVFIHLESIFINNMNKIIDIVPMSPLNASFIYTTPKNIPIKWVIEVNKNYCKNNDIKIGDTVFLL